MRYAVSTTAGNGGVFLLRDHVMLRDMVLLQRDRAMLGDDSGVFLRRHRAMESTLRQPVVDCFATILTVAQIFWRRFGLLSKFFDLLFTLSVLIFYFLVPCGRLHWHLPVFEHMLK